MQISYTTALYLSAIFTLLVVPRALQRFRLPAQLTCFALGIVVAIVDKPLTQDHVARVVATLGIASLFLVAGLEVDLVEIRRQRPRLSVHLAIRTLFLGIIAWCAMRYMHMQWQPATLLALGLLTPSTGFILDTLPHSGLAVSEQSEVAMNSIASEIIALAVLFIVSKSASMTTLATSGLILLLLVVLTPLLFLLLGKFVVPYAPGSEFSLLLMVGIMCAVITQNLGVHYLIGAFTAGLIAGLLGKRMATLASPANLQAVRLFASFFIPFYFFHEGLEVPTGSLVLRSLLYGGLLSLVLIPVRIAKNWLQARYISHRDVRGAFRVSIALVPTLIFTLVIAGMMRQMFHIEDALYGGLLVYAAITTLLPSLILPMLKMDSPIDTQAAADLDGPIMS
ncbi:MAG TPA: cation:proton antiporter [Acidobacteriaceae bacterium]|jgi:Kef-type K+ transport system membrane component KefB|nr:cation:proton antiporter [Acidobacteriaceae bacterium]